MDVARRGREFKYFKTWDGVERRIFAENFSSLFLGWLLSEINIQIRSLFKWEHYAIKWRRFVISGGLEWANVSESCHWAGVAVGARLEEFRTLSLVIIDDAVSKKPP